MNYRSSKTYIEDLKNIIYDVDLPGQLLGSKVLITGANGLIASVLIDALTFCDGINVYALGRSRERMETRFRNRVKHIIQDVTEPLKTEIVFDYIIHAASNAHPLAYAQAPVDTMKANITGTANILEYAQTHGVKRMIFVSSSEVYGVNAAPDTATKNNLQECLGYIDLSDFRSAYPESKRAAEVLCTAYTHQYGISTVCARPWYIYGATFSEASSKADAQFLRKALAGEEIVMKSQGTQMRSYCYVSDCVTAMLKILLYGDNSAYDIAGKDDKTIREFAETIAETANVSIVYEEPDKTEHGGYTKILNSVCGKQRAQRTKELGYIPRYSVKDGIERTLKILRESM